MKSIKDGLKFITESRGNYLSLMRKFPTGSKVGDEEFHRF